MPLADRVSPDTAASPRWLSIVGIGEDGVDGLGAVARGLVSGAAIVFGGQRHLALAAPLIRGAARPWPSPFDRAVDEVLAQRGRPACVLASGDPFMHGVGAVLARHIDAQEMLVIPAPSAFSLAAARLGWALPETVLLSLHARALDFVRPHLQPGARVIALTSDGAAPAALAQLLDAAGFGASRLLVLERLGGPRERIRATTAAAFDFADVDALNTVAIEVTAAPGARVIPRACGLADHLFEHDGQITKREIRAVTLSAWRRAAASFCGTSAPAPARLRSSGCSSIRHCAPSPSRRAPSAPPASSATPPPSACRRSMSLPATRLARSPTWRGRTPSSSAAVAAMPGCSTRW